MRGHHYDSRNHLLKLVTLNLPSLWLLPDPSRMAVRLRHLREGHKLGSKVAQLDLLKQVQLRQGGNAVATTVQSSPSIAFPLLHLQR